MRRTLLALLLWAPAWAWAACSGSSPTWTAANCSATEIDLCIVASSAGDTINVPAGTCSWSGLDTLTGRSLIGPGKDAGSPAIITAGTVTITKHATELTKLVGFRFTGTGQHLQIGGSLTARPFLVLDNYFFNDGAEWANMTTNGGIFAENLIEATTPHSNDVFRINLGGPGGDGLVSWSAATTMGTDDTDGETNTYFEDNTWINLLEVTVDCDNGARIAMRHELFQDSSIVAHGGGSGTSGQDTSSYGCRHIEIYDSTFDRVDTGSLSAVNKWVWMRGSSGVFANNVVDLNDTSEYPDKSELIFSVGCPGDPGHPLDFQFGQSTITPDATPDQPYLVVDNTGTGVGAGFITISGENGEGITCASPGDYIQSGRDYVTTNTWGWTGYTYPHPLRSSGGSGPPPPTRLRVIGLR